jgi:hypothetical protein
MRITLSTKQENNIPKIYFWCQENCKSDWYFVYEETDMIHFADEREATLFILKWS